MRVKSIISRPGFCYVPPELRIISDELWTAVKERRRKINLLKPHDARRPKTLLSGKIDCGTCHAPMTKAGGWFRCTERLNSGACTNGVGLPIAYIERLILSAIQALLLDPELEAEFIREYHHAVAAHNQAAEREAANSESRLRQLDRQISKALDILLDTDSPSLRKRLAELEAEQEQIRSARRAAAVIRLQPQSNRIYKARVARLGEIIRGADLEAKLAREAIRACVSRITAHAERDSAGNVVVEADGDLGAILALGNGSEDLSNVGCGGQI
jgi:hypothetical protein